MATTTKVYYNDSDVPIVIPVLDVTLPAHEHVSVTSAYHPPVVVENFPGLKEITDLPEEEQADHNAQFLANEPKPKKNKAQEKTDEQG